MTKGIRSVLACFEPPRTGHAQARRGEPVKRFELSSALEIHARKHHKEQCSVHTAVIPRKWHFAEFCQRLAERSPSLSENPVYKWTGASRNALPRSSAFITDDAYHLVPRAVRMPRWLRA